MTNKQIRKQARTLYKQNIWRFLLVFTVTMLPSGVSLAAGSFMRQAGLQVWGGVITFVVTVLAYPLSFGSAGFFFDEFHGISGPVKSVARFYRDKKHLTHALVLGSILSAVSSILSSANSWLGSLTGKIPPGTGAAIVLAFISLIVPLVTLVILIFWMFHIFLVPYIYINNPGQKPLDTIKESFRKIRGYTLDLFVFSVSVFWLPFAVIVVALIISVPAIISAGAAFSATPMIALMYLLLIPLGPYIQLATAGFAAGLLSDKQKTKSEKTKGAYTPPKFRV